MSPCHSNPCNDPDQCRQISQSHGNCICPNVNLRHRTCKGNLYCFNDNNMMSLRFNSVNANLKLRTQRSCWSEDLRQQWPEPGCWPAVFVKTNGLLGDDQSRGLRKPGCGHCYLRFFLLVRQMLDVVGSAVQTDAATTCSKVKTRKTRTCICMETTL